MVTKNSFDKPRRIFIDSEYRLFCKDSNYEKNTSEKSKLLLLLRKASAEIWREKKVADKTLKLKNIQSVVKFKGINSRPIFFLKISLEFTLERGLPD